MSNIRVRFAPSPTGFLHVGSLRTILFNYLIAKKGKGKLILRIEDTDQKREVSGAVEGLIDIIDWLGIKFDEGPHIGGDFGPYIQTQRLDIYKKYVNELLASKKAYYCFCSAERLERMRSDQQAKKLPPRYDRNCRDLTEKEIQERIQKGENFVIRQKMPIGGETKVYDELRGEISFKNQDLEDQVLIKSDGVPTYQFASVIDDHLMEISHILRGEEWISSFPKNALLYQAFDWKIPKFIHMPLSLNKEGGKLSKRQGDVAVEDYRAKGYLPEALMNFSVLQGWHPKNDNEIFNLDELEKEFKIEDMGTSPAIFDIDKLDYFNGYYIRQKSIDELLVLCKPFLKEILTAAANESKTTDEYIKKVIELEQERLKKLSEISELTEFFFSDELDYESDLLIWKKLSKNDIKENLVELVDRLKDIEEKSWTKINIEKLLIDYIKSKEAKVGDYLWPMRVALTGRKASPGPFEVAEVLGKNTSLGRIESGIQKLN